MSERVPRISAKDLIRVLKKLGFVEDRTKGSHVIFIKDGVTRVTVPLHSGQILPIGTMRAILDDAGVDVELLRQLL